MTAAEESVSKRPPSFSVVLVIGSLQGGGAERQLSDMGNYWARKGARVVIATWSGVETGDFYSLHDLVRRVYLAVDERGRVTLPSLLRGVLKLRSLLARVRPDVVVSFLTRSNVLTMLAGIGLGVRIVVSERTQPALGKTISSVWRVLRRILYPYSYNVVTQTREAAQWIKKNCRKEVAVIPNALRSLPHIVSDREPLILAIGRLGNEKGFDLLLRAFECVAVDFADWRVAIIGAGVERSSLVRLRDELMLMDRVEFIGEVHDVESWMARAGLVVQPSRFEGFPNVVLESMGMGAAVISADCPSGPSDLIEDGVNGRLVPVEDVATLAQVMAQLMSEPETRAQLGKHASKVRERFRQDLIMRQWEASFRADREPIAWMPERNGESKRSRRL